MKQNTHFIIAGLFTAILVLLCSCSKQNETDYEISLQLEGKKYEQLWLRTEYQTLEKPFSNGNILVNLALEIEGKSDDGYNWTFTISDSIYQNSIGNYMLKKQPFDFENRTEGLIVFVDEGIKNKTFITVSKEIELNENKRKMKIKGKFTTTYLDRSFENIKETAYVLTDTFIFAPRFEYDIFQIELTDDTPENISTYLDFPEFGQIDQNDYSNELQKRIDYVKQHSSSKSLFDSFLNSTDGYKNKEDLSLVFANFSSELRNTELGKLIQEYLTEVIIPCSLDTLSLINIKTNEPEPAIPANNKPTLVIFSASWCGPCHAQIPLLKEIYNDLNTSLNMLYISTDNERGEEAWKALMEKEEIPWRSLFAREFDKGLSQHYGIKGIPFALLITPDGKTEVVEPRYESGKKRLYEAAKQLEI